jgi:hypothetical protein
MRRQIVRTDVSFHFHDAADQLRSDHAVNEEFSQQFARDGYGVAVIEAARQFLHGTAACLA